MATNDRIFYAIHAIAFAGHGVNHLTQPTGYLAAHGLQTTGHSTSFGLTPVFEIGQIEVYENVEEIPQVELTLEKVIDGYPLLQHLASQNPAGGASTLNARYNDARCNILGALYPQTFNAASGTPLAMVQMSGMYLSAIGFTIPVDGFSTESITLVGNNRVWSSGVSVTGLFSVGSRFNNADSPPGTGGVQRRENVDMSLSRWPTEIPGISASGTNNYIAGEFQAHLQTVTISVDLGRTELNELGRRGPYYRYAEFPTEVTCSIEITATELGDFTDAYEEAENLTDQTIKVVFDCGVIIDLGTRNKLTTVTQSGGDATGGNMTTTYNYSNQNSLTVTFPTRDFL